MEKTSNNNAYPSSVKGIRKERVRCLECGYTWTAVFNSGSESTLKCPRCKQRNSEVVE